MFHAGLKFFLNFLNFYYLPLAYEKYITKYERVYNISRSLVASYIA